MAGSTEQGNVVMEFQFGNARVKICDNYCRDRSPQEVDAILKRIAGRVYEQLTASTATAPYGPIEATI